LRAANPNHTKNNNQKRRRVKISNTDFTVLISNPRFDNEEGLLIAIYNQTITKIINNQKNIPQPIAKVLNEILVPCFAMICGAATFGVGITVGTEAVVVVDLSSTSLSIEIGTLCCGLLSATGVSSGIGVGVFFGFGLKKGSNHAVVSDIRIFEEIINNSLL
jgi:hypothetical protein